MFSEIQETPKWTQTLWNLLAVLSCIQLKYLSIKHPEGEEVVEVENDGPRGQ